MQCYIGLIHKEATSGFGVSFPDLPGCVTVGDTLEEAHKLAEEALKLHLEGMAEDGEAIPAASTLDQIMADPANWDNQAFAMIAPPVGISRSVRVNVSLPQDILAEIDAVAEAEGYTRSGFLAHAAKQIMARRKVV